MLLNSNHLFADSDAADEDRSTQSGSSSITPSELPGDAQMPEGEFLPLGNYAESCYLAYSMSVVTGRALPDVRDGQKPVQRRILYAMREMGLVGNSKFVKSARVVGDVIGKLHPHGDTSVYDASVLMAQDFSLRYPLIDGQGNFGSRDGDGAAAMRYTEMRLTPHAELLLDEIDRGTVDFKPNYDGNFKEPSVLPSRLPFVLLNGASGVAVAVATKIPSHNLREVADAAQHLIKHPMASVRDLMQFIQAPDLPGGGHIISSKEAIASVYEKGGGSLRIRARWAVERLARGQWRIVITELPLGVSTASVMEDIDKRINPQPALKNGKKEKDLTLKQKQVKQLFQSVLESIRDDSDEKHPVRLVLEPTSSRQDPQEFMSVLLAHTDLETSLPINMTMLGVNGRPRQKNLKQILSEWIEFRYEVVTRRTSFRLNEVDRRIHILEGRMAAFLNIDAVIRVIRESDGPKEDLMRELSLTEAQAEDILEIRLRQLARLEGIKLEDDLKRLSEEREYLNRLLNDHEEMSRTILREIQMDTKKHGDDRRTLVEEVAPTILTESASIVDEPVTIILSCNGWVRSRQGHGVDKSTITYKVGDSKMSVFETRTTRSMVILDTHGRAYSIRISDIPGGRGDGVPIATMLDFQDGGTLAFAVSDEPDAKYLFAGTGGYGYIASMNDLISRNRAGKTFMTLKKNETPLQPSKVNGANILAASESGRLLSFPVTEMKEMPKGRGVIIMGLDDGEKLAAVNVHDGKMFPIKVSGMIRGGKETVCEISDKDIEKYRMHRAKKGCLIGLKTFKPERFAE